MSEAKDDLNFRVWQTIRLAYDRFKYQEDQILSELGLNSEKYWVLKAIESLNKPVNITDVGLWLSRSTNSVSTIVDRMVKADLITRVRDNRDRRVVHIQATRRAAARLVAAEEAHRHLTLNILLGVSDEDKRNLIKLLEELPLRRS